MNDNHYFGKPCKLGHTIRYKTSGNCVDCATIRRQTTDHHKQNMRRYRQNHPEKDKQYYITNKDKIKAQAKQWRETNKIYRQCYRFGITEDDYHQLLSKQDNKCAICQTSAPKGRGNWHIDHCHQTGKIRGLLCTTCNTGLGHFKDDPELIRQALAYLLLTETP